MNEIDQTRSGGLKEKIRMQCPKCQSPMEEVTHEGVTIDRCSSCKGMWFDAEEQKQLKDLKGVEIVDTGDPRVGKKMDRITDIACPRCAIPMMRMVHVEKVPLNYEACKKCFGIFLDAGEFKELKDTSMSTYLAGLFGA